MKLKVDLSPTSIDKAIDKVEKYKKNLSEKLEILIGKLVQSGVEVAKVLTATANGDSTDAYVDYMIDGQGEIVKAAIYLNGSEAVFIEFGAGIAYNTGKQHPMADEFGYWIGSYPSKHPPNKAINPGRWVYGHTEDGTPLWSIGTEATMPLYHAAETIRNNLIQGAIEDFLRG
jgi:hypothetical protein